jgi:hypothetical protein
MKIDTKLREYSEPQNEDVHGIIFPADVRETDIISAKLRRSGEAEFRPYRVWKLSPLGVELVDSEESHSSSGDAIEIELTVGRTVSRFEGIIVRPHAKLGEQRILGVRFSDKKTNSITDADRRNGSRWVCSSQYDPIGIAPNPAQFNDFLYFKVRDVSRSGIRAITSLRNKFIVPGMELDLQISFPMTSQVSIKARVTRLGMTAESGKDYLEVGLGFIHLTHHQREVIGQYLVQFSNADSLETIRKDGFSQYHLPKGSTTTS